MTSRVVIVVVALVLSVILARALARQRAATERATTRFRQLVEGLDAVVWEADSDTGRLLYVNPAGADLLGYPSATWEYEPEFFSRHVHPEDRQRVRREYRRAFGVGTDHELEYRLVASDGRTVWVHDSVRVDQEAGRPARLRGVMVDVTERRQNEAALQEAEERFRHAFDHAPHGMALVTADGRHLRVNAALCRITGYSQAELLSKTVSELFAPEDQDGAAADAFQRLTADESSALGSESRYVRADGSLVWVHVGASRVIDVQGNTDLVMQVRDIDERKLSERLAHLLGDVSVAVSEADDLPAAFEAVVDHVCSATGWALGQAWVPSLDGQVLELSDTGHARDGAFQAFRGASQATTFGPGIGLPGRVWSSGEPEWISDLVPEEQFPRTAAAAEAGLRSGTACPIQAGDEVVAVIEFFSRETRREDPALRELVAAVAAKLGEVIRRKQAEDALRESELRYRSMTESAPEAIIVASSDGHVISWSRGAAEMFGYRAEEVRGRSLTMLMPERFRSPHRNALLAVSQRAGTALTRKTVEVAGVRANGEEFPIELSLSQWQTGRGRFFGGIIRDISERKQADEALARSYEQATQASRYKSEFLATMSHEIRTPMNAVIGMGRLLLGTPLDPKQREMTETLARSAYALLALIDDILDFSKVEAGKLELNSVAFDVIASVQDAVAITAEEGHRKGLEVATAIEAGLPAAVMGDANRLRQVLINLVGNAVKFTDRGEVVVRAALERSEGDADVIRFEVADTGPGIPSSRKDALFEPFLQADASTSRRYGGTGLGLAICRRLVALMGGEIGVDSQPQQGSTFWFTARFERPVSHPERPRRQRALPDTRALVVDASATQRRVVGAQLRSWGVLVDATGDTTSAVEHLRRASDGQPYDALIVDAGQCPPEVWLGAGAPGPGARQVVLLVKPGVDPGLVPTLSGAVRQLAKPVRQSDLYDLMVETGPAGPPPPVALAPEPTIRRGRILVVEDNLANQQVARLQLESLGYEADVVDGGAWAIEALARRSYAAVLMDCQMPGMDGYQTTSEIRRREGEGGRTPIIAMTAAAMRGDREQCLVSGMDDYISKPVDPDQLDQALARWVGSSVVEPAPEPPIPMPSEDDRAFDWERLRALQAMCAGGNGPDRWPQLIALFLDDADERVAKLRGDAGDVAAVRELAHGLKGSSANFGVARVRELSAQIEALARNDSRDGIPGLVEQLATEVARARAALCPPPDGTDLTLAGPGSPRRAG